MRQFAWRWFAIVAVVGAVPALAVSAWAQDAAAPAEAAEAGEAAEPAPPPVSPPVKFDQSAKASMNAVDWPAVAQFALCVLLTWCWVASSDWVSRDSQIFSLGYKKWNPIVVLPFFVIALALTFIPVAWVIRVPALLVVYLASILPYVVVHNKSVLPHQTVLTGSWWRHFFASMLGKVGVKVSGERKAEYEKGAAVDLFAMGATDANQNSANLITARQSPGYLLVKDLVAEMATRRADRVLMEYGPQAVAVRHEIDGVWHNSEARDRESGDVMLAVMKTLANLNAKERRQKQSGQFGAQFEGQKFLCPLVSQGTANGERVVVSRLFEKGRPHTYDALGIREGLRQQWEEIMGRDRGLVIFSALPGGGLTTMMDASLDETDRLMREFFAIEEVNHREHEIQNIIVETYDASKGETPATIIPALVRRYPNVYVVRDLVDAESATLLMNEIPDDRLVITSIPAKDAAEALLRLLAMKLPAKQFASVVTAVLYQRLIRTLCTDCKVGYTPPPDVLKKLGIPAGKVQQFFRPPKPEEIEKPCETCRGLGYFGRTGLFELLVVTDQMREILVKQPNVELLRKAARADQQRSLQEEGILLVAKGVTSLPELMRVLK